MGQRRPGTRAAPQDGGRGHDDDQLADLDAEIEGDQRPGERLRGQPELLQHRREPEAMDEAEEAGKQRPGVSGRGCGRQARGSPPVADHEEVVGAHHDDRERNQRLDNPARWAEDVERRQRERDAVPDGEGGHDQREPFERAARQQQADQEQHMVRTDQDVFDTREHEGPDHRPAALGGPGEEPDRRVVGREDALLPQRAVFVNVHEGLVNRVVGEQHRMDVHPSGSRAERE